MSDPKHTVHMVRAVEHTNPDIVSSIQETTKELGETFMRKLAEMVRYSNNYDFPALHIILDVELNGIASKLLFSATALPDDKLHIYGKDFASDLEHLSRLDQREPS